MKILQPGVLALIQDLGRIGKHRIGLTVGGPMDPSAFRWANRLCHNPDNASAIEISIGGFAAEFLEPAQIAITGATVEVKINGKAVSMWETLNVHAGDTLKLGFATEGCRIYLAIQGGIELEAHFGSTATVVREGLGGLSGKPLAKGDLINVSHRDNKARLSMPTQHRPNYADQSPLRVVLGYQAESFSSLDKARFFHGEYTVSERMDRMGYRLTGPACHSSVSSLLSEGISHGAIQVPPDGQPIVLLNDRQTIGGYPKLGSVMALDTARLAQMTQGKKVHFTPVTVEEAHVINMLARNKDANIELLPL
ncbi:biotin-dependent carboxyltransferase family protein [Marinomonas sp. 15G1-11]|uniref:Biotin-dependent carboxyltransferase family protein n=1 Tax=Marinomonas phaeophyticola TaxID=3004091 RepID=A0ABT4JUX5_9GAMM|nr:biotin-dependent carboxyltransferase family protein [Marinomonas sp. 15G1-11]MCZ2722021.1 biotin-dependent carboxyltransferase family protein [Marinomonas sp. 15G1-11]